MFERFTKDARDVVKGAVEYADGAQTGTVDAEHLLRALLERRASRASFALAALGVDERGESVRRALDEARRRAGLSQAESDALAGLGIDVSEIVATGLTERQRRYLRRAGFRQREDGKWIRPI